MSVQPLLCEGQDKYTQLASAGYINTGTSIENNQEFPPPLNIKILEKKENDKAAYSHCTVWQCTESECVPV